jgi:triacylglycerol lipase
MAGLERRPDVTYSTYAGVRELGEQPIWLRPFGRLHGEPNDGMVAASSALWDGAAPPVRADHFELAGWSLGALPSRAAARPFPHVPFYAEILDRIAGCRRISP